jgi:TolB-like protein/DNA-binding winged helix-turn-helix (wHTH) protein/tetratricopeptide (TPR) repeat protein
MILKVNGCSIDTDAYELRRNGELVPVEPQVFDLLVYLLKNPDRVITKDEIIEHIWCGRSVSDAALSSRIKAVRQAIGDDGTSQTCIRTVHRRGFRVVAPVTLNEAPTVHVPPSDDAKTSNLAPAIAVMSETIKDRILATIRMRSTAIMIAVAAVLLGVASWSIFNLSARVATSALTLRMPTGPAIAVFRFQNPSSDPALDFLESALTEEIATQLTRFSELRVAARAPVLETEGNRGDLGRKLGAEFLVQGSVRRSGERVRLSAQLVKATDGTLLWAETYERKLTPEDLFSVQDDIASKVVAAVASFSTGAITRQRLDQARGKPPRALSAYECTIRTNEMMLAGYSADTHLTSRNCLEAAVEAEPDYAAAWAMLAWVHTLEYSQDMNKRHGLDPRQLALAAARRAIALAPANPMARFAMARASYLARDLEVFYAEAERALTLNPHEPFLLGNIGCWFAFSGRWDEGVALVRKAIALNPKVYPRWWHAALGKNHFRQGEYREALGEFKNMNLPNWWWNQVELAYTYGQLGELENARAAVTKLIELYPGFDLEKAAIEHMKFSFEQSYIERAVEGLKKAGVPHRSPNRTSEAVP